MKAPESIGDKNCNKHRGQYYAHYNPNHNKMPLLVMLRNWSIKSLLKGLLEIK